MAGYLTRFLRSAEDDALPRLSLVHVIDEQAFAKFLGSPRHTGLRFSVDAAPITKAMAGNVALGAALDLRNGTFAGRVDVSLSYGSDQRGGSLQRLREIVPALAKTPGIRKLEAKVKSDDVDATTELLDLLKHRVMLTVPDEDLIQTQGLRYDRDSRMRALRREFEEWLRQR